MISVAMIVKDEAEVLEKCLESVKTLDEIVIVDTGSSDNTKDIARKYTDKVYDFKWCDDFSKARNFALDKCTQEWRLILDADEWLEGTDGLRHACKYCPPDVEGISFELFTNDKKTCVSTRMVRKGVKYKWAIHEYPDIKKTMNTKHRVYHKKSPSHGLDPDRNLRMLEKAMKDEPCPRYRYYLGVEYMQKKMYDKAFETLKTYVKESNYPAEKNDAILLMAWVLLIYKKPEAAKACLLEVLFNNPYCECAIRLLERLSPEPYKGRWADFAAGADNRDCLFIREVPYIKPKEKTE